MIVMIIYDQDDNRDALHEEGKMINMQSLCVFTILLKLPSFWAALLGKQTQTKQQHDDGDNLLMTSCPQEKTTKEERGRKMIKWSDWAIETLVGIIQAFNRDQRAGTRTETL